MTLEETQEFVAARMDQIVSCFKDGVKLTVLVRTPGRPERDFLMSNDDLTEIPPMIERRMSAGKAGQV